MLTTYDKIIARFISTATEHDDCTYESIMGSPITLFISGINYRPVNTKH